MTELGALMEAEIREQPAVFERILSDGRARVAEVAKLVERRRPRFVLFIARGTSDHAALYGKYLVETRLGLPAGLGSPSSTTLYDARPAFQDVLLVAVSQSGSSPDIVRATERARACGATTLALTNSSGSELVAVADFHLPILAGQERSVAATKTYTAELLTIFLLVNAIAHGETGQADALAAAANSILERAHEIEELAARYRFADHLLVTSRGYNFPTALETALKLVETAEIPAHAFSGADLMHGPMAMIDHGFPVVAVVPPGAGGRAMTPVVDALRQKDADILVVGSPEGLPTGLTAFEVPSVREPLSPLILIIPMQLFALHLARDRGRDPDAPRGLTKVTRTV